MPETNPKAYEYFRMAREHRGQSLIDVANALYLNVTLLEQIEMGEFSNRRFAPVFMRGYVRSYAKYLQLSETIIDEIMLSFDVAPQPLSMAIRTKQAILKKHPLNRYSAKKTVAYTIIVFLLILGAFFLHHFRSSSIVSEDSTISPIASTAITPEGEILPSEESFLVPEHSVDIDKTKASSEAQNNAPVMPKKSDLQKNSGPEIVDTEEIQ